MYRLAETKNKRNASVWYTAKPGTTERGNSRPQISGVLERTPDMVQAIIDHGPINENQMIQCRFSCWKNDYQQGRAPSHRGSFDFSNEQKEEFAKSKSA